MSPQQIERLRQYATDGLSKAQAADREGISHSTAQQALNGTDLAWGPKVLHWNAVGTTGDGMSSFNHIMRAYLESLRNKHSKEDVARLTGMNFGEQQNAINQPQRSSFNWTLGQITRIGQAVGKSTPEMLEELARAMRSNI